MNVPMADEKQENQKDCATRLTANNNNNVSAKCNLPQISGGEAEIRQMLSANYGLRDISLTRLDGYDDLNYHIQASSVESNPHLQTVAREGLFLKISNFNDSQRRPGLLSAIWRLMEHLLNKGIVCQRTIRSKDDQVITSITSSNASGISVAYLVSVRTFLPGTVMAKTPITSDLLYKLGIFAANITEAMQDFGDPFFKTYGYPWDLANCPKILDVLSCINNQKRKDLSTDVIRTFESDVLTARDRLRTGQIHNDLNEHNILVGSGVGGGETPEISGLLDLGDTCRTCLIYDLAICAAHQMMRSNSEVPLLDIPGILLAGYQSVCHMTQTERDVFSKCVAARMVMVLVSGEHEYQLNPNNDYLVEYAHSGWKALKLLWEADKARLDQRWQEIIGLYS